VENKQGKAHQSEIIFAVRESKFKISTVTRDEFEFFWVLKFHSGSKTGGWQRQRY
jgi:hypothetical protein